MLLAVIARPTRPGGRVVSFDATQALQFSGVKHVVQVPSGVVVVADNFWSAYEARDKLRIEWDDSQAERFSSASIDAQFKALLDQPGMVALKVGTPTLRSPGRTGA